MKKNSVGIIGLGYVGLPLAISFGKKRNCIGFDLNKVRVNDLKKAFDRNKEFSTNQIKDSINLKFTNNLFDLENCEFLIVTAPTPITKNKEPDLSFIEKAAKDISKIIKKKMIIILESTVYPGVTEDFFAKIISLKSGLRLNKDFFVGYSPERINPGDKLHSLENVTKVVSGSNKLITKKINTLYKSIIKEIFVTKDIKTAEAAKIIENIQRDVNIALINEYYQLFEKLNLNTHEILKAASTKWNFLNFKPGLVGGHCIGVDPYYLTHLAKKKGYKPNLILAGRNINDTMHKYLVKNIISKINFSKKNFSKLKILVLGATFKENCSDLRNSGSLKFFKELQRYNKSSKIYDPVADQKLLKKIIKSKNIGSLKKKYFDLILMMVPHNIFKKIKKNVIASLKDSGKFYDYNNSINIKNI